MVELRSSFLFLLGGKRRPSVAFSIQDLAGMLLGIVSGKALAAGFAFVPAASALPLKFKKRYLTPLSL